MDFQAQPTAASSPPAGDGQRRKKRNRPALSCIQCRSRKIKCDRNEPCASCIRSKIVNCTYEEARRPKPRYWKLSPDPDLGPDSAEDRSSRPLSSRNAPIDLVGQDSAAESAAPAPELGGFESSLDDNPAEFHLARPPLSEDDARTTLADRVRQLERQLANTLKSRDANSRTARDAPPNVQGILAKTRYLGMSHWMNVGRFVSHPYAGRSGVSGSNQGKNCPNPIVFATV